MEKRPLKAIHLDNGHTLVISDLSRKISEDGCIVVMQATMEIPVKKTLFSDNPLSDFKFQDILNILGQTVVYEYRTERNFIMVREKDKVFESLAASFLDNLGVYVAKPHFPARFVLRQYQEKLR